MNLFNPLKVIRDKDVRREHTDYYSRSEGNTFVPVKKDLSIPEHNAIVKYRQKTFYFMVENSNKFEFSEVVKRYFKSDFQLRFI